MAVLQELLNYKAQKDAQSNADISAIPQAAIMLQQAKQQQYDNLIKGALASATLAQSGLKMGPGNSLIQDSSLLGPAQQIKNMLAQSTIQKNNAIIQNMPVAAQQKQENVDQKAWQNLTKQLNPQTASSRSTLGLASAGNLRADRAMATLNNSIVTNQDAGNVMADLASIYQGGVPTDYGMSHQNYATLQQKLAGAQQFISGKPTDALSPEIKKRLINVITELKQVNNDSINQNFDYIEKANKDLIGKFPDEWKAMREQYATNDTGNQTFNVNGKTYNVPADQVDEFKKDMGIK